MNAEVTLYVSPGGDDRWSGRRAEPNAERSDGPLATPARARDLLRTREDRHRPATVVLRGGTYFLAEPLRFEAQDSGTAAAPVTYAAYPGEQPVLSAGQRVSGWEETTVGKARAWAAPAPAGFFRQLWVNGARRQRPRLPEKGIFHVAGLNGPWKPGDPDHGPFTEFRVTPEVLADWKNLGDVDLVMLQRWVDYRMPLLAVDREAGRVTTALAAGFIPLLRWASREFSPFYLENVVEALSHPGEWYLDRKAGRLYYLPFPEETPDAADVIVPRLEHVIVAAGDPDAGAWVEHVHFRDLTLAHNEWQRPAEKAWRAGGPAGQEPGGDTQAAVNVPGAFEAIGLRHSSLRACTVAHGGSYAIQLGRGCRDNVVSGCDLHDMGAGGVKLGTVVVDDAPISGHNEVSDCRIHDSGVIFHSAVGIWVGQSGDNLLAHNEIDHLFYTGISLGWSWDLGPAAAHRNLVEYNHIHDIGQGLLSDMGGIYTLGISPGTVLRCNRIHDVESADYNGDGIYHDAWCCDVLDEYNLVYRCSNQCLNFQHGHGNVARNNIFAISDGKGVIRHGYQESDVVLRFEQNIVYCHGATALDGLWDTGEFHFSRNLYWDASGQPLRFGPCAFPDWQRRGHDRDSVIADPGFARPEAGDFTLAADSPALALGFVPFDLSTVGPRRKTGAGSEETLPSHGGKEGR